MSYPWLIDIRIIHAYDVSMRKMQVLFPEPQLERLKALARVEDRPVSEIIRRAAEEYLARVPAARRQSRAAIPVFDGGRTLADAGRLRDLAYEDRAGGKP
jgi:hypothetical protein